MYFPITHIADSHHFINFSCLNMLLSSNSRKGAVDEVGNRTPTSLRAPTLNSYLVTSISSQCATLIAVSALHVSSITVLFLLRLNTLRVNSFPGQPLNSITDHHHSFGRRDHLLVMIRILGNSSCSSGQELQSLRITGAGSMQNQGPLLVVVIDYYFLFIILVLIFVNHY